jgi:hypothetical protein
MEIFIVGIVVVALMVYVSTRIKKSAETAFERETIETDEFRLVKPEGLLHPLRDKSEFAFEAYSKNFGAENLRNIWQSNAELLVHRDAKFKDICADVKRSADKILSENVLKETPADQRICLIKGKQTLDDVKKYVFWKIVESLSQKKVYELRVYVLEDNLSEFSSKIEEMLESFTVN